MSAYSPRFGVLPIGDYPTDSYSRLKDVKDANDVAPDGTTIKGRLESLVHQAAKDIKACSNACDTYSKKKLVGSCP